MARESADQAGGSTRNDGARGAQGCSCVYGVTRSKKCTSMTTFKSHSGPKKSHKTAYPGPSTFGPGDSLFACCPSSRGSEISLRASPQPPARNLPKVRPHRRRLEDTEFAVRSPLVHQQG